MDDEPALRVIGFRRSQPFGDHKIPWRFWLGPIIVAGLEPQLRSRVPRLVVLSQPLHVGISLFGVSISVSR